ncbi:unnamed protein product [Parascedosporium putredinis]|uniref:DUF7918 domain-containing protein n=1 Tax=Parascedosporium putredinis TaxID=1442378 RepID=A0A9P1H524_9PEZI|nr:unnamed protein product [Parascedosporium putredinis]CAI7996027.1 unnamed protein product [Parascedosporium putredinis]
MTNSPNETIAAYIYFDGRAKEEVATLLRPGEETWVNSRWVQVPESEGGGLAEREFLFREVGLERWLNGLDLQGDDAQAKIERRRKKFEKRRRRQRRDEELAESNGNPLSDDDSDSLSDDDEPPEATGQIKVSMFRVLASGEIKKGEYSPQFDAHDDDEDDLDTVAAESSNSLAADVEHTTSFAKPKTLDPSTISTQTVTGIDGPDKPYATFTFFYRGERQLQKIGVLSKNNAPNTPGGSKRRSAQLDFSTLGPLKTGGTVGFSAFRDAERDANSRKKARKKSNGNVGGLDDDSDDDDDDDDEILGNMVDVDEKESNTPAGDTAIPKELADGVDRMRLKRAHSADPDSPAAAAAAAASNPTSTTSTAAAGLLQPSPLSRDAVSTKNASTPGPVASAVPPSTKPDDTSVLGSPMKRHRPSISGPADNGPTASGGEEEELLGVTWMLEAMWTKPETNPTSSGKHPTMIDATPPTGMPGTDCTDPACIVHTEEPGASH